MADHYLEFSEEITRLTPDEITWLKQRYEQGPADDETWDIYNFAIAFQPHREEIDGYWVRLGTDIWIHTYDSTGNPEHVAEFVQEFLQKFRPRDVFTLTWASYCSKPRTGDFGGGAVVVTADRIKMMDTWQWARQLAARFPNASSEPSDQSCPINPTEVSAPDQTT